MYLDPKDCLISMEVCTLQSRIRVCFFLHLSSPESKAHMVSLFIPIEPASVCPSVDTKSLSNLNISAASRSIATKLYLKHRWGWGMH